MSHERRPMLSKRNIKKKKKALFSTYIGRQPGLVQLLLSLPLFAQLLDTALGKLRALSVVRWDTISIPGTVFLGSEHLQVAQSSLFGPLAGFPLLFFSFQLLLPCSCCLLFTCAEQLLCHGPHQSREVVAVFQVDAEIKEIDVAYSVAKTQDFLAKVVLCSSNESFVVKFDRTVA